MDGDLAPLADLAAVAAHHDAALIVDEAHALGVLGPGGRGLSAAAGVTPDALVGTLGKALGSAGGFVAGDGLLRTLLINRARSFIFTTALPPPVAAAATAALEICTAPEGEVLRTRLARHIQALQDILVPHFPGPATARAQAALRGPILPVILGSDLDALATSRHLLDRGYFVQAIRPPTVPEGTSRLRVTLSAAHIADDVAGLGAALTDILRGRGPASTPSPELPSKPERNPSASAI